MRILTTLAGAAIFVLGCGLARTPETYRDDTRKLLDTRSGDIKTCYDGVLKTDPKAGGRVTVKFAFKEETGELIDAQIDPASSTAPSAVRQCVVSNLNGIVIKPADRRRGEATWSWEFNAAAPAD